MKKAFIGLLMFVILMCSTQTASASFVSRITHKISYSIKKKCTKIKYAKRQHKNLRLQKQLQKR